MQVLEVIVLDMPAPIVKATLPALAGFARLRQLSISVAVADGTALEGSALSGLTALQDLRLSFYEWVTFGKEAATVVPDGGSSGEAGASRSGNFVPASGGNGSQEAPAGGQDGEQASSSSSVGVLAGGGEPAELLPSLTRLELRSVDRVEIAAALRTLRELVTDEVERMVVVGHCLARSALSRLVLSGGGGGQAVALEAGLSGLPALAELRLENVEPAAATAWPGSGFSALPHLAELSITCSTKPAQQAAAALLRAAPAALRSLELRLYGNSDGSAAAAVGGLTQLTRLVTNTPAVAQHFKVVSGVRGLQSVI